MWQHLSLLMSDHLGLLSDLIPDIIENNFTNLSSHLAKSVYCDDNVDFSKAQYGVSVDRIEARYWNRHKFYQFVLPRNNLTLLHICAIFDSLECFLLLRKRFQSGHCLRIPSGDSYTPLHYACLSGSLEIACYIVGEDPSQRRLNEKDLTYTRLELAAKSHSHFIISLLFDDIPLPIDGLSKAIETAHENNDNCSLKILLPHQPPNQSRKPPLIATEEEREVELREDDHNSSSKNDKSNCGENDNNS
jgi:hypothetical protein